MTEVKTYTPKLQSEYNNRIIGELLTELSLSNINEVPRLEKIVVSVGLGKSKEDKRVIEAAANTLARITGQRPIETKARKSIANFKLREGQKIGLKVTLRGQMMYEFADRLFNITLPRLRDFHGLSPKSFDRYGNYSLGLTDQSAFAELSFEETATPHGLQITFCVTGDDNERARKLLEKLGLPFEKGNK